MRETPRQVLKVSAVCCSLSAILAARFSGGNCLYSLSAFSRSQRQYGNHMLLYTVDWFRQPGSQHVYLWRCPLPKTQSLDENLGHVLPLDPGAGDLFGDRFRIKSPHGGHQVINGLVPILCRSTKMFTPLFCCKHDRSEISPPYSTVHSFKCMKW